MSISYQKEPIAQWLFEDNSIKQLTWLTLERAITSCATVVSILSAHRLLFPTTICFSQWMQAGEHEVAQSKRVEKADISINLSAHSLQPFVDVFSRCRSIIDGESVYPLKIKIFGDGVIVTNQGDSVVNNLVWVGARTLDKFDISVVTQSDIWLPFSLRGDPQPDVYRLNAGRLAYALQEIEQQTDFKLEEGLDSYYSTTTGFYLDNIRYADGSIVDVSDVA